MSQTPKPAPRPRARRYDGFEGVRLCVTVRVGRSVCKIGDLAHLEPGQVVTLDRRIGEAFELCCGDVLLGSVELVAERDGMAVKLVRVAEDEDDPA